MEEGFWRGPIRVVVLLRLDGCIEAEFLVEALERLQRRHPKLRAVIAPGSGGRSRYQFDQLAAPIPFEITDCDEGESPWREETRRLLELDSPPAGPLAAVSVLRSRSRGWCELILSVYHGIADGRSGLTLVDDLLTEYANAEAHLEATPRPALPAISAARARPSGGWRGRFRLIRRFVRIQREERRSRQTSLPEGRDIPPLSQWMHWVLSREDTHRLVRRCRTEQVSSSGALAAAAYCGLMDCLPVSEAFFKWHCPFDVRESLQGPYGPVTAQDLGSFASMMRGFYKVPQQPAFWDLARRVHQDIQMFVKQGGPAFAYNLGRVAVSRLFPQVEPVLLPWGSKRPTVLFTNYGVLNIRNAYGGLRPRECTLIFKGDNSARPWLIMEALVMGQQLNIGFAADGLEPAFWDRLHVAVGRHVAAAAAPAKPGI